MNVMFERCAGLDVHKQSVVACRMLTTSFSAASTRSETRSFGTTVPELLRLSDWLSDGGLHT